MAAAEVFWSAFAAALEVVASPEVRDGWHRDSSLEGFSVGGPVSHRDTDGDHVRR
jgi:hypothetical protein